MISAFIGLHPITNRLCRSTRRAPFLTSGNQAMATDLPHFLEISAWLTGFEVADLEGTGMADTYLQTVQAQCQGATVADFFAAARGVLEQGQLFPAALFDGLAHNIVFMWYSGQWAPTVDAPGVNLAKVRNISPAAYVQGLMWPAADTHPPGAKAPGYGSWAQIPVHLR
jgi:hypothetical protein